jgi:hypothetical protein
MVCSRFPDPTLDIQCSFCGQAASNGANYSQGAAGGVGAGDSSPAESFRYGEVSWLESEADTPYVGSSKLISQCESSSEQFLSPRLDNDDSDIPDFPHTTFCGLEGQTVFPPLGNQGPELNQGFYFGNIDDHSALQSLDTSVESWSFRGQAFGDRFYRPHDDPLTSNSFLPMQQPTIATPKVLDLKHGWLESALGQDLEQETADLIVKIEDGYNIQAISENSAIGGIEALRQGIAASGQTPGERSELSAQEIQRLLVRGMLGDPATSKGHIAVPLTAEHLQTALNRYGQQKNASYKLGVVRSTQSTLNFELSMLPNPPFRPGQIIIWVYQELVYNASTGYYDSRWAAITPNNIPAQNSSYAQVLQSPTPKIGEAQKPVDPQLLHDGRRSTMSSSNTESLSLSTASSTQVKCCGKVWLTKATLK